MLETGRCTISGTIQSCPGTSDKREMELIGMNTLLAYADDLVILKASINEIKTSAKKLFKANQNMSLIVN